MHATYKTELYKRSVSFLQKLDSSFSLIIQFNKPVIQTLDFAFWEISVALWGNEQDIGNLSIIKCVLSFYTDLNNTFCL